jgi:hypothetical protein
MKSLSLKIEIKTRTYDILLKAITVRAKRKEKDLTRVLEIENIRRILGLRIIRLKWLKRNPVIDDFSYIVIELYCFRIANKVIEQGLIHDIKLKSVTRLNRII